MPTIPSRCSVPEVDEPDVLQEDRHPALLREDDVPEVIQRRDQPDAADDDALLARDEDAAAGIGVVVRDRALDIAQARARTAASLAGSTTSWNDTVSPPNSVTSATPATCLSCGYTTQSCRSLSSRGSRCVDCSVYR